MSFISKVPQSVTITTQLYTCVISKQNTVARLHKLLRHLYMLSLHNHLFQMTAVPTTDSCSSDFIYVAQISVALRQ